MKTAAETLDFWDEPLPAPLLRRQLRVGLPPRRVQAMQSLARGQRPQRRAGYRTAARARVSVA